MGSMQRRDLVMMFTCTVCDTRSTKAMSRQAYETGVVIVSCPGCKNNHLIADHLGWFDDESFTIEKLMEQRGETIVRGADGTVQLTAEDIAGRSSVANPSQLPPPPPE